MLGTHQASSRHHIPSGVLETRDVKQPEEIRGGHRDGRLGPLALQEGGCRVGTGSAWSRSGFGAPNSTPPRIGQGLRGQGSALHNGAWQVGKGQQHQLKLETLRLDIRRNLSAMRTGRQ